MALEINRFIRFQVPKDNSGPEYPVLKYDSTKVNDTAIAKQAEAIEKVVADLEKAGMKPSQTFLRTTAFHSPRECRNHDH